MNNTCTAVNRLPPVASLLLTLLPGLLAACSHPALWTTVAGAPVHGASAPSAARAPTLGFENHDTHAIKGPIPRGVYALVHVDATRTNLPSAELVAPAFVTGLSVRTYWSLIERSEGVFDWTVFDRALAAARTAGKKTAFRVMNGTGTPEWVYGAGARRYDAGEWQGQSKGTVPVPWDPVFHAKWRAFLRAFAARYDGEPAVAYIAMSMPAGRWAELFHPKALREHPDYTYARWRAAHEQFIGYYADAFRSTPLTLALSGHGPLGPLVNDLTDHLVATFGRDGTRVYIQANGWADNGVMGAPDLKIEQSFAPVWEKPLRHGFQQVAAVAWARRGDHRMGDQTAANALLLRLRGEYAEVYDADILDPAMHPPLRALAAALAGTGR